ncbi:MAG: tetraacyldisaccharide 4'-kinase [Planctomycetota bacterium]
MASAPIATHGRHGERLLDGPARVLALPGWLALRPAVALRNLAYDRHWLPIHRLPAPVIGVGNLSLGGTGKTPVVAAVVAALRDAGLQPAVLMRGYLGDGVANDEARTLDCPVVCDPDRHAGGQRALADGADCLVLDDGFQHRRLHRDCDLVCIDATRPGILPHDAVFPLGRLREPLSALRRATALVLTRSDQVPPQRLAALTGRLARCGLPLLHCHHHATGLAPLAGPGRSAPPDALAGEPVLLASGLGHPAGFEATARALGMDVRGCERYPDHHAYTAADARFLSARAHALGATLVVTAKDAVKLAGLPLPGDTRILLVEAVFAPADARRLAAICAAAVQRAPRPHCARAPESG